MGTPLQEYPVNAGFCQISILGRTLSLLYINGLFDDGKFNIAIYADDTIYLNCDKYLICGNN